MKRILVTGAAGFIGTNIIRYYKRRGFVTEGWDIIGKSENDIISIDMMDAELIRRELNVFLPDLIIHCAGLADVRLSVENPVKDFESNVTITHILLNEIKNNMNISPRIIFLSSAAIYGNPKYLPVREEAEVMPKSPYALHKAMCEQMCMFYFNEYNMDICVARIFSAYGAGLRKQIFWDMYHKVKKTGTLQLFGTGDESRDYIHINDVINAISLIAEKATAGDVINVANGEECFIREVSEIFVKCLKRDDIMPEFTGNIMIGTPKNWCADISKLKRLGYKKTVCLETGITDYLEWAQSVL